MNNATNLHPELIQRQEQITLAGKILYTLLQGLSDEQFFRRPNPGQWSIAECIDHLCQTARATAPKFDRAIEKGRQKRLFSNGPFHYGRIAVWFVDKAVEYPPTRRFRAPGIFVPPQPHTDREKLLTEFAQWQTWLCELLQRANGLDLKRIKVSSPVSSIVRIPLGQYIRLVTGHQIRHLKQAAEVKSRLLPDTTLK